MNWLSGAVLAGGGAGGGAPHRYLVVTFDVGALVTADFATPEPRFAIWAVAEIRVDPLGQVITLTNDAASRTAPERHR